MLQNEIAVRIQSELYIKEWRSLEVIVVKTALIPQDTVSGTVHVFSWFCLFLKLPCIFSPVQAISLVDCF